MPQWGSDSRESATIAGYGVGDSWYNVERGDPAPSETDLIDIDQMVVSVKDADGESHYYTIYGGFDDWQGFYDYIEIEIIDYYGPEFA